MIPVLALSSVILLLVAGAIELWWGSAARQQQRRSLAHIEGNLASSSMQPLTSEIGPVSPRQRGQWRRLVDSTMLRANLPTGWRMPVVLTVAGLLLAVLGAWRIGTAWAAPVLLCTYAIVVWLWLHVRMEKQRQQLIRQLPDFLDSMVRLTSIGNSLPMAFQSAANGVHPPLRSVLDRTMHGVRTGQDLDRALQQAAQPYRIDVLDLLHVVLGTGMRMGGRADQILQRMSDFLRDLSAARQEMRAITSETRMSAWVLGLLPVAVAILMSLTNPGFFHPMLVQPLGHKILLIALAFEAVGVFLLYRLAKSL